MPIQIYVEQAGNESRGEALRGTGVFVWDSDANTLRVISTEELGKQALAADPELGRAFAAQFPGWAWQNGQLVQTRTSLSGEPVPRLFNFSAVGVDYLAKQGIDLNKVPSLPQITVNNRGDIARLSPLEKAIYDTRGNGGKSISQVSLTDLVSKSGITPPGGASVNAASAANSYVYDQAHLGSKANDAAVNTLYQAYFGRNASAPELANWGAKGGADTTVKALEDFLKGERVKYGYTAPVKSIQEIQNPGGQYQVEKSNTASGYEVIYYPPGKTPDPNLRYPGAPAPSSSKPTWTPPASGAGSGPGGLTPPPNSSAFKSSSAYKALSSDLQQLVDLAFSTFSGTPEQQQIFSDALANAAALADPYSKAQLKLAKGEYESQIAFFQGDLQRASEVITRTLAELKEDVTASTENLTLQEQADIAKETQQYNKDLLSIADTAANKGLTFATGIKSRAMDESNRTADFGNVIQSTQRQYNFNTKALQLRASRGDVDAQKQLADLEAKSSFNLKSIGSNAEKILGSANLPNIPGYTPSGGVLGSIEQERRKAILDAAGFALPQ